MSEVQEVVQIASNYLKGLIDQAKNVRLEQVEETPEKSKWSVVLSFPDEVSPVTFLTQGIDASRVFKEIVVDAERKKATALRVWKY